MKSTFLKLQNNDLFKGFIIAVLTVVVMAVKDSFELGVFPTDLEFWKAELMKGVSAGLIYLSKNLLSNSDDKFLKGESGK